MMDNSMLVDRFVLLYRVVRSSLQLNVSFCAQKKASAQSQMPYYNLYQMW